MWSLRRAAFLTFTAGNTLLLPATFHLSCQKQDDAKGDGDNAHVKQYVASAYVKRKWPPDRQQCVEYDAHSASGHN